MPPRRVFEAALTARPPREADATFSEAPVDWYRDVGGQPHALGPVLAVGLRA